LENKIEGVQKKTLITAGQLYGAGKTLMASTQWTE
jgi:hypothetical protein